MTGNNKNTKVEKVFFDLKYRSNVSKPYCSAFGDMSIDKSELEDISAHSIYVYLLKHYKELILNGVYKNVSAQIHLFTFCDTLKSEVFRVSYEFMNTSGVGTIDFIATNIRIIEV